MASRDIKRDAYKKTMDLAEKLASSGSISAPTDMADFLQHTYKKLIELLEDKEKKIKLSSSLQYLLKLCRPDWGILF